MKNGRKMENCKFMENFYFMENTNISDFYKNLDKTLIKRNVEAIKVNSLIKCF